MATISLANKEAELLGAIIDLINTGSIDWKVIANKAGYDTAKKARDKWYPLRDKLTATVGKGGEKKGTPKRKKDGEGDDGATPPKKSKQAPTKGKKATTDDEVDGEGDGDADVGKEVKEELDDGDIFS